MRVRPVLSNLGAILRIFGLAFLLPALVAWAYEPRDLHVLGLDLPTNLLLYVGCAAGAGLLGQALMLAGRLHELRDHEGYIVVGFVWLLLPAAAAAPLVLGGAVPGVVDGFYEGMSAITTTGFSVVRDPDAIAQSHHAWRATVQWVGGGGVAILSVAVLSRLTESGARMMRAEIPGGSVTRLAPKVAQTAKILWGVYVTITLFTLAGLFGAFAFTEDMPLGDAMFDAATLTMSAVSTGGFSYHSDGLARYDSPLVEGILIGGMVLGGTSFTLLYYATRGEPRRLLRDTEFRFFLFILAGATALVAWNLLAADVHWQARAAVWGAWGAEPALTLEGIRTALRYSSFQVASVLTGTGYSSANYDEWPEVSRLLLLLLMFTGAMIGSTTGALKLSRTLLLGKIVAREFQRLIYPKAVLRVRLAGTLVPEETLQGVVSFFFAYVVVFLASTVFLALHGFDILSAVGTSAGSLGNVGLGLGLSGPAGSVADFSPAVKMWLVFIMWVGRLEILAALTLFVPTTYRR